MKNIRKLKNQHGFTMVELIAVIVVIGVIATFTLPNIASDKEDTLYATTQTMMSLKFPETVTKHLSRTNTCVGLTKTNLTDRGLEGVTPWGDSWTVSATAALVTVVIPLSGSPSLAADGAQLVTSLGATTSVNTVAFATPNLTVTYNCR